jgi:parvulin-like peptidyl-prolyl isomerase
MTFRAKPVVKRTHKAQWESQDRRNFYTNLAFGLVVLAAVLILLFAAGLSWYNTHWASVGSVDGQSITKDEFKDRYLVEQWRISEASSRIVNQRQVGRLTDAQAQTAQQYLDQQTQSLPADTLERIIDTRLQATLAAAQGITATPEDIDARLVTEATSPESRHAWAIEVAPATDAGATAPTEAQKAAAKAKADAALADLQAGKAWDEVAKVVSTDTSTAPQAGDLGWIQKDDPGSDEAFINAVFAAPANAPTAVVEGADGTYRIGRATEIVAETVDGAYQAKIENNGISLANYRAVVAGDVIHQKLQDKIVADASKEGPQRQVSEIYIAETSPTPATDAVKVRHIQYSPKDDPEGAPDLPATDPAWTAAKAEADAAYEKLKADPSLFDSMARTSSDEASAKGDTGTGGKLGYIDQDSDLSQAEDFKTAILAPGLQDGQLLAPVKTTIGWHVIQVMYHAPDAARMAKLKTDADGGADFAALARDNSESETASKGGDLGWVAPNQLDPRLTDAIFAADVGKTSNVVSITGDGTYLFKVFAEEDKTPEGRQLEAIQSTAFSNWYQAQKAVVKIERDPSITGSGAG